MRYKKLAKIAMFSLCCVIIGLIILFVYNSIGISQSLDTNAEDINKTALINALESYYGEWEIVEDFGYHGIHKMTEIEVFEVGEVISFYEEAFRYKDRIDIPYPHIIIEVTTSPEIQQYDGMLDPGAMGFTVDNIYLDYAKIYVKNGRNMVGDNVCILYILNDNEIIIEGDVHRYYRAMRKN